jgi:CRP/FNR family transcriptional regulator, cyclic AMP receptor protein
VSTSTEAIRSSVPAAMYVGRELAINDSLDWVAMPAEPVQAANTGKRQPTSAAMFDPVHLYSCSQRWYQEREAGSGWDLVHALRSGDPRARAVAAELLAKTEHVHLPAQAVRRIDSAPRPPCPSDPVEATGMKSGCGVGTAEGCMECEGQMEHIFCRLSGEGLKVLDSVRHPSTYPGDALLFVEGHAPRGAFVLCSGQVKLSTTSREGKVLILRIAEVGDVLGLSAAISGENHELSAETLGPCHVNFLERKALLLAIENSSEFGLRTSLALSREFHAVYRDIHDLMLARSSTGKLARLLLSWARPLLHSPEGAEIRIPSGLTHEEMAQRIGLSRETVTRLLGSLKKRDLIRLEGSTLVIRNRVALEALAA